MSNKKVGKEQCPACAKNGGDTSQDNLIRYDDGSAYCFACSFAITSNGVQQRMTFELPPAVRFPDTGLSKKKISRKTLERFGVLRVAATNDDGTIQTQPSKEGNGHEYVGTNVVGLPFYDIDSGALLGCKMRRFGGAKKDIWMMQGSDTKKMTFFGINAIPSAAKTVILCEGETDTLSMAEVFPEYGVLGIPGADTAEKAIKGSLHVLKTFNRIIVSFDNDEAGNKARDTAISLLPAGKTFIANLPSEVNDINELLVADRRDDIKRIVRDAKQITPKGVVDSDEFKNRVLNYIYNRDAARGASTGFKSIDRATGGCAPGKLITIAGGTGSGKSTLAEAIAVNAALISGAKTFFIPLEMTDSQVGARMLQQILHEPIAADPFFNINNLPRLDVERAIDLVRDNIKFLDHYNQIEIPTLIETCEYAIDAYDCKIIVLDHITAAAGLDWKDIDMAVAAIKEMCLRRGVCVILVSHISGGEAEEKVPSLKDIRGSRGIAQYSDCVLGIGRVRSSPQLEVKTIKVDRMCGKYIEFQLKYEGYAPIETGEVVEVQGTEEEEEEYAWETNERDSIPTDGAVQVDIRGDSSDEHASSDAVRTVRTDLSEDIHTRLSTEGAGDTGRDEGLLPSRRPHEDEASESLKPRARYSLSVPTDSDEGSTENLRNVG